MPLTGSRARPCARPVTRYRDLPIHKVVLGAKAGATISSQSSVDVRSPWSMACGLAATAAAGRAPLPESVWVACARSRSAVTPTLSVNVWERYRLQPPQTQSNRPLSAFYGASTGLGPLRMVAQARRKQCSRASGENATANNLPDPTSPGSSPLLRRSRLAGGLYDYPGLGPGNRNLDMAPTPRVARPDDECRAESPADHHRIRDRLARAGGLASGSQHARSGRTFDR